MLEAARGWLTPAVLFVLVNLVVATIAVASWLMSPDPAADDEAGGARRRGVLLRAPSLAVDRLRASFSFSRLGLAADHAPLFDYAAPAGAAEPSDDSPPPPATASPPADTDRRDAEPEEARVERSRSEAAAEAAPDNKRRPRGRRVRRAATEEPAALLAVAPAAGGRGEEAAVEVDERADDFIRRFREQLRLQRLDSILRYRDTLRRTGTA
ncbi:unnamed protein product [Urochloa humidicola]